MFKRAMADSDNERTRRAFGRALRDARLGVGLSPTDLASVIGKSAGVVNNYEDGEVVNPQPWACIAMEAAVGKRPGELTQLLGFVPADGGESPCTVETAILADDVLDENQQQALLAVYRSYVSRASVTESPQ